MNKVLWALIKGLMVGDINKIETIHLSHYVTFSFKLKTRKHLSRQSSNIDW